MQLNQVTVEVTDIDRAVVFYAGLGLELIVLVPHYARFIVPGNQVTFSIHKSEHSVRSTTTVYFEVADLDATVEALKAKGYRFSQEPTQQSWLWYEAYLDDPDGNPICLYFAGENGLHPPWRIAAE